MKVERTFGFHLRDVVLGHGVDSGSEGFHVRADFLTEDFEVRFDLLDETNLRLLSRNDDEFLDVDLRFDKVGNVKERIGCLLIRRRYNRFLERLTDVLLGAFAEREDGRCRLLREVHLTLERLVDEILIGFGPRAEVYRFAREIPVETVCIERCVRRHELRYGLKTGVEGGVCSLFVCVHLTSPETLAVQTHIPVREVVLHEIRDSTSGFGGFVCFVRFCDLLDEGVELREDPSVDFREVLRGYNVVFDRRLTVG